MMSDFIEALIKFIKKLFLPHTAKPSSPTHHERAIPLSSDNRYNSAESRSALQTETLVDYLIEAESYTIHYNKGERGKTAPGGIYYKYFPQWEGWRFLTHLAKEYGIVFDPAASDTQGCKELTALVQESYREEMDQLLYDFVRENYYKKLQLHLFPGKKSALSYFSIVVNGGKRRAAKILQKVLVAHGAKIAIDGKAGPQTHRALAECGLDDTYLNQQILLQVYYFYNYLIGRNPAKYRRFYNGWINRLKHLGFVEPKV